MLFRSQICTKYDGLDPDGILISGQECTGLSSGFSDGNNSTNYIAVRIKELSSSSEIFSTELCETNGFDCYDENNNYITSNATYVFRNTNISDTESPSASASPSASESPDAGGSTYTEAQCNSYYGSYVTNDWCNVSNNGSTNIRTDTGCDYEDYCSCTTKSYTAHPECSQYNSGRTCSITYATRPSGGHSGCL